MLFGCPFSLKTPHWNTFSVGGRPSSKESFSSTCMSCLPREMSRLKAGMVISKVHSPRRGFWALKEEETFIRWAMQGCGHCRQRSSTVRGKMPGMDPAVHQGPAVAPQRCCVAALTFLAGQDIGPFPNLFNNRQHSGVCSVQPMVLEQMDPIKRPS